MDRGTDIFRLFFAEEKGERVPPCGYVVNCFLRKRRGAWVVGLLALRALPYARAGCVCKRGSRHLNCPQLLARSLGWERAPQSPRND